MASALYRAPSADTEKRVSDLLDQMSLEEKCHQLSAVWVSLDPNSGEFAPLQSEMLKSPEGADRALKIGIGQICRPFGSRPVEVKEGIDALNAFQKKMVEGTRLGIPVFAHEECLNGQVAHTAVQYPCPLNLGASWNPDLVEVMARQIGSAMRSVGVHQGLAPVADVAFDIRWGRTEETYGEDPDLVGKMATAFVKGLQGNGLQDGVVATLKHFAGYALSEGGRNFAPANVGRRYLEDMVFPPFEMAIREGDARSVMNAYQDIDGEPAAASAWLLTDVLRRRWGFQGIVVADYFAVAMLMSLQRTAEDPAEAAAQALAAGLDVELPVPTIYPDALPVALERGLVSSEDIDEAVRRVLRIKFHMGLFETPFVDSSEATLRTREAERTVLTLAEQSIVLLKNDGSLPVSPDAKTIAVIGPNADTYGPLFGDYSFPTHVASSFREHALDPTPETILQSLQKTFADRQVHFAKGCDLIVAREDGLTPRRHER